MKHLFFSFGRKVVSIVSTLVLIANVLPSMTQVDQAQAATVNLIFTAPVGSGFNPNLVDFTVTSTGFSESNNFSMQNIPNGIATLTVNNYSGQPLNTAGFEVSAAQTDSSVRFQNITLAELTVSGDDTFIVNFDQAGATTSNITWNFSGPTGFNPNLIDFSYTAAAFSQSNNFNMQGVPNTTGTLTVNDYNGAALTTAGFEIDNVQADTAVTQISQTTASVNVTNTGTITVTFRALASNTSNITWNFIGPVGFNSNLLDFTFVSGSFNQSNSFVMQNVANGTGTLTFNDYSGQTLADAGLRLANPQNDTGVANNSTNSVTVTVNSSRTISVEFESIGPATANITWSLTGPAGFNANLVNFSYATTGFTQSNNFVMSGIPVGQGTFTISDYDGQPLSASGFQLVTNQADPDVTTAGANALTVNVTSSRTISIAFEATATTTANITWSFIGPVGFNSNLVSFRFTDANGSTQENSFVMANVASGLGTLEITSYDQVGQTLTAAGFELATTQTSGSVIRQTQVTATVNITSTGTIVINVDGITSIQTNTINWQFSGPAGFNINLVQFSFQDAGGATQQNTFSMSNIQVGVGTLTITDFGTQTLPGSFEIAIIQSNVSVTRTGTNLASVNVLAAPTPQNIAVEISLIPPPGPGISFNGGLSNSPGTIITHEEQGIPPTNVSVRLTTVPTSDVTLTFTSINLAEGRVTAGATMTFTAVNAQTEQILTVAGVDDTVRDGDVGYNIVVTFASADPDYQQTNLAIAAINIDNESSGGSHPGRWNLDAPNILFSLNGIEITELQANIGQLINLKVTGSDFNWRDQLSLEMLESPSADATFTVAQQYTNPVDGMLIWTPSQLGRHEFDFRVRDPKFDTQTIFPITIVTAPTPGGGTSGGTPGREGVAPDPDFIEIIRKFKRDVLGQPDEPQFPIFSGVNCDYIDNNTVSVRALCLLGLIDDADQRPHYGGHEPITRAAFTKIMVKLTHEDSLIEKISGLIQNLNVSVFPDVDPLAWHAKYIAVAKRANEVRGYPHLNGHFIPWNPIEISEAAKIAIGTTSKADPHGIGVAYATAKYNQGAETEWYRPYTVVLAKFQGFVPPKNVESGLVYSQTLSRQHGANIIYALIRNASLSSDNKISKLRQELEQYEQKGLLTLLQET
ncbi:MAG: hypothetical protein Q8P95_03210 [bacterium]|nr:hypothetical protein [bacterium]